MAETIDIAASTKLSMESPRRKHLPGSDMSSSSRLVPPHLCGAPYEFTLETEHFLLTLNSLGSLPNSGYAQARVKERRKVQLLPYDLPGRTRKGPRSNLTSWLLTHFEWAVYITSELPFPGILDGYRLAKLLPTRPARALFILWTLLGAADK